MCKASSPIPDGERAVASRRDPRARLPAELLATSGLRPERIAAAGLAPEWLRRGSRGVTVGGARTGCFVRQDTIARTGDPASPVRDAGDCDVGAGQRPGIPAGLGRGPR